MRHFPSTLIALLLAIAPGAVLAGRPLAPEDWYRFNDVHDIQVAPDGGAVAYLVTTYGKDSDETTADLWLSGWDGKSSLQMTRGESVSDPRFSPDGRYLSFLAAHPAGGNTQLWALDRRGGEPRQLSHVTAEIAGYEWSPDGAHVVLVMRAGEAAAGGDGAAAHRPRPLVIDAYHFKEDGRGYLTAESRAHLYLLDAADGSCVALTRDPAREDTLPAFSPDGHTIAYVSNEMVGPHGAGRDEIELIAPDPHATARQLLTTWSPNHQHLAFSPDGRQLAFLEGDELKWNSYILDRLAVADVSSGQVRELTAGLDRAVVSPAFTADGRSLEFAVEDDGYQYPAAVRLADGRIERLAGPSVVTELASAAGHTAVLAADDHAPFEVFALENGGLRALTTHTRALFSELTLGSVEDISFRSRDGTEIHGQIVKPPGFVRGQRYPTIVWIHGGPNGQDDHSLKLGNGPQLVRQLFATHGFVVLAINYRGGTGRGAKFARSIFADWGHLEIEDLEAGVDYAIAQGSADPQRLGVGGWSYGGILTDFLIAHDARFKAASSGAGSANQLSDYGADEYIVQYQAELGPPWKTTPQWLKVSYPFFHADRIHTPTLFLGGTRDFDVPLIGGEQMYEALRVLGVPTELIVYPGETHEFDRPSFLVDRFQRYLDWMTKYLEPAR